MKNIILSLLIVLGIVGCASMKQSLIPYEGTWILKYQSGGFAGKTIVPNKEIKLIIANKKISRYEDEQLLSEEDFKTIKGSTIQSDELKDIVVNNGISKQSIEQKGDTLIISDQCYDCFTYLYIKEK